MKRTWIAVSAFALLLGSSGVARAEDQTDIRIYLDGDVNVLRGVERAHGITLRPMIRTEQRYRVGGLYLLKAFIGVRSDLLPWLRIWTYYAHNDKWSNGVHQEVHMAVFDLMLHHRWGPVALGWRLGNEYHSAPGFYRLRNYFDLAVTLGVPWLRFYASEEFRFDSDPTRINMNDIRGGLDFIPTRWLKVRAFYDLELNRRSRDDWKRTHVAGLMLIVRPANGGAIHPATGHHE